MFKIIKAFTIFTVLAAALLFTTSHAYATEDVFNHNTQSAIDNYQSKYFEIIKRHNLFLQQEYTDELKQDKKDLDNLFAEVEGQITDKYHLKKYKKIQKRYANCNAETTVEIKDFANRHYKEINRLLDKVYKKAQTKSKDYKMLVSSQDKWIKDVELYNKVFNTMDYGTIGGIVYYDYQINMREFRTLLLMLYL